MNAKKLTSNRLNAKKSTGPKNTMKTHYNALSHGLLAQGVTELDGEGYDIIHAQLIQETQPQGVLETFLVEKIALNIVRLQRAALLESELFTEQLHPPTFTEKIGNLDDMLEKTTVIDKGRPAHIPATGIERLISSVGRYETMIENRFYRLLNQLERLQRSRSGETIPAPLTVDCNIHGDGNNLASFGNQAIPINAE